MTSAKRRREHNSQASGDGEDSLAKDKAADNGVCRAAAAFWNHQDEEEQDEEEDVHLQTWPQGEAEKVEVVVLEEDEADYAWEDVLEGEAEEEETLEDDDFFEEEPDTSLPQPCTPQDPLQSKEGAEAYDPQHRELPQPSQSSLRASGGEPRELKVTFLDDETVDSSNFLHVINVISYKHSDLWYTSPGQFVQCGWCEQYVPQALGRLHGDEGASQLAQPDFVCNKCLEEEASGGAGGDWQPERETNEETIAVDGQDGPWDNPWSGWDEQWS